MGYTSRIPQITIELPLLLEAATREAAELIAENARARVPVDTGRLRDAIHTQRAGRADYAVIAGDDEVFYGHIVEHGSVHTPPRPFLVPALEESRAKAVAITAAALKRLM